MKILFKCGLVLLCGATPVWGGTSVIGQPGQTKLPSPTPYAIKAQDANSRVWERTVYELDPSGQVVARKHSYSELASGLNHLVNGQWMESKETIDILPDGTAAATNGQHQTCFPGDIYEGQIELVTPDGQHLTSRPLALSYFDGTNTAVIAELTNATGYVAGDNQVIYPNAFTGIKADLCYTYTKAGFSQDVILRTQPPTPESLGLNADTARLQVMTEFFEAPQPAITASPLPAQAGTSLTDQTLGFGAMQMIQGRAFLMGQDARGAGALVSKHWVQAYGRQLLIEEVPVNAVVEELAALPLTSMNSVSNKNSHTASRELKLPPQRLANNNSSARMLLAKAEMPANGFVLDYQTINSSQTNYTFRGDTTYYISGTVNAGGTTIFEGGAVLKYTNNASLNFDSSSSINCLSSAYRPIIFTSIDDNSVGEPIIGSMGTPTNYCANPALGFGTSFGNNIYAISYFRIAWAKQAITSVFSMENLSHGQLVNCLNGISLQFETDHLRNMLFANVQTNFNIITSAFDVQNTTFSGSSYLAVSSSAGDLHLTNCILANVTQLTNSGFAASLAGDHNGFFSSPTFGTNIKTNPFYPFQTVGGGSYYLTNNCNFLNAGTTNIEASILADIKTKTTCPPISYTNVTFTTATTFSPQAQRDTDTPDLGYHYDPLDYVFGGCTVNSNTTFTAGTAVGWFRTTSGWMYAGQGIQMSGNIKVLFAGTATSPTYWVRLNTVQEQDQTAGYGHGGIENWAWPPIPTVRGEFLRCSAMAGENFNGYFCDDYGWLRAEMINSEFWGGQLGTYGDYMAYTNCLFQRVAVGLWSGYSAGALYLQNCTMYGGVFQVQRNSAGTTQVSVRNSAFDGTTNLLTGDYYAANATYTYYDYNAYTNTAYPFSIGGAHDVIVTGGFNWQTNWLGNFYQSTNSLLIDKGSAAADQLGLYHFTTQTNQVKETNSTVDIGYHYVATDSNGNPLDSNGNGNPDYLEDGSGQGQPLSIILLAPTNNVYYTEPANIPIQATVFDWSSAVTNVSFFRSAVQITGITNAPYQYTWPVVGAGAYSLTATARDLAGSVATSSTVTVTVTNLCGY